MSALASAFPRDVAAVVRDPTPEGAARLAELRAFVERFPRQAALKRLLGRQGVPVREDVRAPLRGLTTEERDELDVWHGARLEGRACPAPQVELVELLGDVRLAADQLRACATAAGSSSPNTTTPKRSLA